MNIKKTFKKLTAKLRGEQKQVELGGDIFVLPAAKCAMCGGPIAVRATIEPCGHSFDDACAKAWLNGTKRNACPVPCCRTVVKRFSKKLPKPKFWEYRTLKGPQGYGAGDSPMKRGGLDFARAFER